MGDGWSLARRAGDAAAKAWKAPVGALVWERHVVVFLLSHVRFMEVVVGFDVIVEVYERV